MTNSEKTTLKQEKWTKAVKIINLIFAILPIFPLALIIFLPFGKVLSYELLPTMCFIDLAAVDTTLRLCGVVEFIVFAGVIAAICGNVFYVVKCIIALVSKERKPVNIKTLIIVDVLLAIGFSVFSSLFPFVMSLFGIVSMSVLNLLPTILLVGIGVLFAVFAGIVAMFNIRNTDADIFGELGLGAIQKKRKRLFYVNTELFVCTIATLIFAFIAVLSNIFTVNYISTKLPDFSQSLTVSGWALITDPTTIVSQGQQILSFIIFVAVMILIVLSVLTIVSYASRSDLFGKISLLTIFVASGCCLAIGLIGKYYEIIQDMNHAMILKMILALGYFPDGVVPGTKFIEYSVVSYTIFFLVGALAILAFVFFRRPYSRAIMLSKEIALEEEARLPRVVEIASPVEINKDEEEEDATEEAESVTEDSELFIGNDIDVSAVSVDPCPTFTSIDSKCSLYSQELLEKRKLLFEEPSLSALVDFIVQYARDSRLHLFYTQESIAEFLAGLGTTRLSILQGMSGTGKTSLPKIVSEALCSVCDIVEVESAWRDKNELLGYYNEFSKTYTPKKFTEALYRAKLNPEVITFIVLDEMNLSRIEYYFSDFLSLMENEPGKRDLKLLNTPIERVVNGQSEPYYGLVDGHTIKVPENVWFIGTANRDESTFDISDKVYDRAHTMNFDKRATRVKYYSQEIPPRYISANTLLSLFENAKNSLDFSLEHYPVVSEVERLLEPYNISFGNRIEMQIESFVKIYTSCFAYNENVIRDGLEIILLSKVVRKLEFKSVEDKEELAAEFGKLGLMRCCDFILNLRED